MRKLVILIIFVILVIVAGVLAFFSFVSPKSSVVEKENTVSRFYNFESQSAQAVIKGQIQEIDYESKILCLQTRCIKWGENTLFFDYSEIDDFLDGGRVDKTLTPQTIDPEDVEVTDYVFVNLENLGIIGFHASRVSVIKNEVPTQDESIF